MRRFLTAGLLCLVLLASPVRGQPTKTGPLAAPQPQTTTDPSGSGESASAVPWVAAVLFTIVILSIVCMPSRKN